MAYKVQKPCKVCGKMYTPCSDCESDKSVFHWRTVACSLECGMEYFKRVESARKHNASSVILNQSKQDNIVDTQVQNINNVSASEKIDDYVKDNSIPYRKTSKSRKRTNKKQKESESID